MAFFLQNSIVFLALHFHSSLPAARALSIPPNSRFSDHFLVPNTFSELESRDTSTCGGDSSLTQCGASFPTDFCCAAQTTCLQLNTSSSIVATLCCPAGQDCSIINPINCNESYQNVTSNPNSQLHAVPPTPLETCGDACCPMSYSCSNGRCVASAASSSPVSSSSSTASPSSSTSPTTPTTSLNTASAVPTSSTSSSSTASPVPQSSSTSSSAPSVNGFSGKSFAAGFVPGIAIGVVLSMAGLYLISLRQQRRSGSYVDEKHDPTRDTLTDLGPELDYRPTTHGRSISEPMADPDLGHRTVFLQPTPPRDPGARALEGFGGYNSEIRPSASGPNASGTTAQDRLPRVKALLSRSPFMNQAQSPNPTQAPLPDYLKRGTVSYQITPVRGLKKQRSMHSLRRQHTNTTSRSGSSRQQASSLSRSGSTETIQVLMQTPDHAGFHSATQPTSNQTYGKRNSSTSWQSTDDEDTTPIDTDPVVPDPPGIGTAQNSDHYFTPTRSRRSSAGPAGLSLGTPYTPSNFNRKDARNVGPNMAPIGLSVEREDTKRDTTFSAMMERAGFRKEDLMMSGGLGSDVKVPKKR